MTHDQTEPNMPLHPISRRSFLQSSISAATAGGLLSVRPVLGMANQPALLGGSPAHSGAWPSWPVSDSLEEDGLRKVLQSGKWYRYAAGKLTIEGHRLDAPAPPLIGEVPDGYGLTGFQVSGITFPTDGCWEITGTVGTKGSLTFIVQVIYPKGFTPAGTPQSASTPDG